MLKRVVIKEELVELTGDYRPAIILNQFIYWTERMKDTDKYIQEETERALKENIEVNIESSKGWIYKTSEELNEEIMLNMSNATIRKYIKQLIEKGYMQERRNPKYKWDKTMQYRVDIYKIQLDLAKLGYALEGYRLLPGIEIIDNKKDLGAVTTKPSKELENKKDSYNVNSNKNSIPQNSNSNNKSNKEFKPNYSLNPKIHKNLSTKFLNYGNDEDLERMLLESQKSKF